MWGLISLAGELYIEYGWNRTEEDQEGEEEFSLFDSLDEVNGKEEEPIQKF